jgi:coenzyme PQQ precursor peptide PqqA
VAFRAVPGKDSTGERLGLPLIELVRYIQRESQMAWKAPKIVEVTVGMEINMYMCATRK